MTDDRHDGNGGWQPHPQGEYDSDATAFVQLPEGALDFDHSPLAAPGHGYVPPQITVTPTTADATDPAATGVWVMPPEVTGAGTGGQDVRWPDAGGMPEPSGHDVQTPGHSGQFGHPEHAEHADHSERPEHSGHSGLSEYSGHAGRDGRDVQEHAYDPRATGQWNFHEAEGHAPTAPAPADVTGQWSIPVANGDLPDESGEFTAPSLAAQWGGTPPATLPGGAAAPWATGGAGAGAPWSQPAHQEYADPHVHGDPHGHAQHYAEPQHHEPVVPPEPFVPAAPVAPEMHVVPETAVAHEPRDPHEAAEAHEAPAEPDPEPEPAPEPEPQPAPEPEFEAGTEAEFEAEFEPEVEAAPADASTEAEAEPEAAADPEPEAEPGAEPGTEPGPEAEPEPVLTAATAFSDEHPLCSYVLRVNGVDRPVTDAWIGESLLYVLRERLGLAGAKDGCSQGECGACNVQVDGRLVASCLVPAATAAGSEVRTVEGLAVDGRPSDVQRALAACGAVQCGFCVPGMAMTLHDLLEGNPAPTDLETRRALCGNLCRCSGYRGVLDAVQEVVAEREASATAAEPSAQGDGEARIPHQAGPGAGGVNPAAQGGTHEGPYGQDGGQA
ncbi:(2Fe-2S)-binding protein [Streptomyces sp. SYP-A7185]|uniref:(2Fe-2S)-binding protein n=1 Tax=Streptomyces sp. SYP-A7185 TaxID=3040076 RepID=UPI0038F7C863